ncbi:MAG: tyrosine decarboxylase MfnA [Methanomicrobiales archaeon]|nr:tyrosine decarboxylase MfnA [Methanomicrobiales archaeon]
MREHGCSEDSLFSFLHAKKSEDRGYHRVLSSMCSLPHPVAVRAHMLFLETNLGDPGLFLGTASLEAMLIARLGNLLHHPRAAGYATSGGTESNIQALRIAKKRAAATSPNVVVPESAHFSFDKACDLLSVEMRTVPSDAQFRMDADCVQDAVDRNTIAIVGVAGTTEYGTVDPIEVLSDIAVDRDLLLHVDAAFGGLVLPFIDGSEPFDFALPGVASISVDPHKMGLSTIPAGCLLTRDEKTLHLCTVDTPYLTVKHACTLSGTRPGAPVASAIAVMDYLGRDGMQAIVAGCMKNTRRLIAGMETYGYPVAVEPAVNVAAFSCPGVPPGWIVSRTRRGHLRIVCMPHVHRDVIELFLEAIGEMNAGKTD